MHYWLLVAFRQGKQIYVSKDISILVKPKMAYFQPGAQCKFIKAYFLAHSKYTIKSSPKYSIE